MARKGDSILHQHADLIIERLKNGTSLALLKNELDGLGCFVVPESIRKWINKKLKDGTITTGLRKAGRPSKSKNATATKLPPSSSLGRVLFPQDVFSEELTPPPPPAFYDLEGFLKTIAKHIRPEELALAMCIPCRSMGNPDFQEYALKLGKEKINRLTDLDYILLGIYEMRRLLPSEEIDAGWLKSAHSRAIQIRKTMLGFTSWDCFDDIKIR